MASPSPDEIHRVEAGPVSKFLNFEYNNEVEDREKRVIEKINLDKKMNKFLKCK